MYHWKYRAFDHNRVVHDGIAEADNFIALSVHLRNNGLQIIEATKIHPDDSFATKRLEKLRNAVRVPQEHEKTIQPQDKGRIHRLLSSFISLFRRT